MRRIPRIIHKIFFTSDDAPPPRHIQAAIDTWTAMNSTFELQLYDIPRAREFIREHMPECLRAFDMLKPYSYKSDLFRFILLYTQGGVYSDIRQACLVSLDSVFAADMTWFSAVDIDKPNMYTATLVSVPGHAYMREAIDRCVKNTEAMDYSQGLLGITGPGLLGKVIRLPVGTHDGGVHIGEHVPGHVATAQGVKFITNRMSNEEAGQPWSDVQTGNNYRQMFADRDVFEGDTRIHSTLFAITPRMGICIAVVIVLLVALVFAIYRR